MIFQVYYYYTCWRKKWQSTAVILPGTSHARSLVGYGPWGLKESDTTEWLSMCAHTAHIIRYYWVREYTHVKTLNIDQHSWLRTEHLIGKDVLLTRIRDLGICWGNTLYFGFTGGSDGIEFSCNAGEPGSIPGRWGDALETRMSAHSSTLAWRIPWKEESGRLQFMGSQRVGHHWVTNTHTHTRYLSWTVARTREVGQDWQHLWWDGCGKSYSKKVRQSGNCGLVDSWLWPPSVSSGNSQLVNPNSRDWEAHHVLTTGTGSCSSPIFAVVGLEQIEAYRCRVVLHRLCFGYQSWCYTKNSNSQEQLSSSQGLEGITIFRKTECFRCSENSSLSQINIQIIIYEQFQCPLLSNPLVRSLWHGEAYSGSISLWRGGTVWVRQENLFCSRISCKSS